MAPAALQAHEIEDLRVQFDRLWDTHDARWDTDEYCESVRDLIRDCRERVRFDSLEQPLVESAYRMMDRRDPRNALFTLLIALKPHFAND